MPQATDHKWTLTGVSPSAKKAAREAAKREHMALGAWIERAIKRAAVPGIRTADIQQPQDPRPYRRYF